jgi:queuine tRNA-ribosyltransferase
MNTIGFEIVHVDKNSNARTGILKTAHGDLETPCFTAVATRGVGKFIGTDDYEDVADGLISNALVLSLRPGVDAIQKFGTIHDFIKFHKPIFTDCGGFQMLRDSFMDVASKKGIHFKSPYDYKKFIITPEKIMKIEQDIGADAVMMLDDVAPYGSSKEQFEKSLENTHRWAALCKKHHTKKDQFLYGIVQGGFFPDLRKKSAEYIDSLEFDGLAIGGVAIGETREEMYIAINASMPHLNKNKPKHLLGVGSPDDIVECVGLGLDTFDSVFPTQNARHGCLFTMDGRLDIMKSDHAHAKEPIEKDCDCLACKNYSRAYIRHLLKLGEAAGKRYATIHNLHFMKRFMAKIRSSIRDGTFEEFKEHIINKYRKNKDPKQLVGVNVKQ